MLSANWNSADGFSRRNISHYFLCMVDHRRLGRARSITMIWRRRRSARRSFLQSPSGSARWDNKLELILERIEFFGRAFPEHALLLWRIEGGGAGRGIVPDQVATPVLVIVYCWANGTGYNNSSYLRQLHFGLLVQRWMSLPTKFTIDTLKYKLVNDVRCKVSLLQLRNSMLVLVLSALLFRSACSVSSQSSHCRVRSTCSIYCAEVQEWQSLTRHRANTGENECRVCISLERHSSFLLYKQHHVVCLCTQDHVVSTPPARPRGARAPFGARSGRRTNSRSRNPDLIFVIPASAFIRISCAVKGEARFA
jgi:hypothetical protein